MYFEGGFNKDSSAEYALDLNHELNIRATIPAVCGIIAPPLMVVLWAVASFLRPGYNQLAQKGSELGTGLNSIIMNLNFAITGILIIVFALGLIGHIRDGNWYGIGITLLWFVVLGKRLRARFHAIPGVQQQQDHFPKMSISE